MKYFDKHDNSVSPDRSTGRYAGFPSAYQSRAGANDVMSSFLPFSQDGVPVIVFVSSSVRGTMVFPFTATHCTYIRIVSLHVLQFAIEILVLSRSAIIFLLT